MGGKVAVRPAKCDGEEAEERDHETQHAAALATAPENDPGGQGAQPPQAQAAADGNDDEDDMENVHTAVKDGALQESNLLGKAIK